MFDIMDLHVSQEEKVYFMRQLQIISIIDTENKKSLITID